jgi:hypothetical protein
MSKAKVEITLADLENSANIKELEVVLVSNQETILQGQSGNDKVNIQSLPLRPYLDQTVIPILLEGLKLVANER